jgi:hypothetical protein
MSASRMQLPPILRLWWGIRSGDDSAARTSQPCTCDAKRMCRRSTGTGSCSPCKLDVCSGHIKAACNTSAISEISGGGRPQPLGCGRVKPKEGARQRSSGHNRAHAAAHMRREREKEHKRRRLHNSAHAARSLLALLMFSCVIVPAYAQSNNVVDAPKIISLVADDPDDLDGTHKHALTSTPTHEHTRTRRATTACTPNTSDADDTPTHHQTYT